VSTQKVLSHERVTPAAFHLCLKSTGEPSVRVPGFHMFTEDGGAFINEDILKNAIAEWGLVPKGDERTRFNARNYLARKKSAAEEPAVRTIGSLLILPE
jgi:hypothetical protein